MNWVGRWVLLALLVLLVFIVIFVVKAKADYGFNMTTVVCDGDLVRFTNGSLGCVDCKGGAVFNNATGGCDLPDVGVKAKEPSFLMVLGGKVFPENPSLGALALIGAAFFVGWRLLKVARS